MLSMMAAFKARRPVTLKTVPFFLAAISIQRFTVECSLYQGFEQQVSSRWVGDWLYLEGKTDGGRL